MINYSIIIPHRDSLDTLPRLFNSIPARSDIEIIIVDNSDIPIIKEMININREYSLYFAAPSRFAGGARNVGLENCQGKWVLFSDADDFFAEGAFDIFDEILNSDFELVYFKMSGVYDDTLEPSDRGDRYSKIVENYLNGNISEIEAKISFSSPCSKLVRKSLIDKYNIRFDEVVASNDVFFSLLTGYYSSKFNAVNKVTYVATTRRGSLLQRRDLPVIKARYMVALRKNQFLRVHKLGMFQESIMYYLYESLKHGFTTFGTFSSLILKYRQNPFIGYRNWLITVIDMFNKRKINSKYITK